MNRIDKRVSEMKSIESVVFSRQICCFYHAATCLNFTKAALTMGLDQSAVSHAVRNLESKLGVNLFYRQHRGVRLTPQGELLLAAVQNAQLLVSSVVEEIAEPAKKNQVTLSMSNATATNLVLPKLAYFKVQYPDIDISCVVNDFDVDLQAEGIDLAIPLGTGPWKDWQQWFLTEERISAVASPSYVQSLKQLPKTPADLTALKLIHINERQKTRFNWRDWFDYFDQSIVFPKTGVACNDYSIVLQMAIDGQGVALGWEHLVARLIKEGKLVKVISHEVVSKDDFVLLASHLDPLPEAVEKLRRWVVEEVFEVS